MTTTPRLGAPEVATSQSVPGETVNEQIRWVEQGANRFIVKDKDLTAAPGSPADGDAYIVPTGATGTWSTHVGKLAFRMSTGWLYITPIEGTQAYVQDENVEYLYNGATWGIVGLGGGLTLDTDGALAANSDTAVASQKATKTYVDGKVAGLSWKLPVRVATTTNGTLATAFENGDTVDGVTLVTGDRILIKDQSSGAENGIYVVAASGAATRATDADSGAELVNATVYVSEGATFADKQFTCTTNGPITVGSTSLTFGQLSTGGSGDMLGANNLSDVGNAATALQNLGGIKQGLHTLAVMAGAMIARTTNGAASGTSESTTNKVMTRSLDFDQSTIEYAQFTIPMPKSWNEGTITAKFIWACGVTGDVIWGIQAIAISDDDVIDTAFGTAQEVTDSVTATTDKMTSAATSAMTVGGSPAAEDDVVFQVYRKASDGADTAAGDAKLLGVRLYITLNAGDDS